MVYHKYSPKEQVFARAKASSEPACSRITNDAKGASAAAGAKGETERRERGCEITDSGTESGWQACGWGVQGGRRYSTHCLIHELDHKWVKFNC